MEKKTEVSDTPENKGASYKIKIVKIAELDTSVPENIEISSLDTLNGYLDINKNESIGIYYKDDAKNIWKAIIGLCEDRTKYKEYAEKILQFDRNKENNSLQALKEMAEEVGVTGIDINVKDSENVAEALTKISIAQEQKKQNEINSSKLLEKNEVSTVDLKTDFNINTTVIGVENVDINVSSKREFIGIFEDSYIDKKTYFSNDPKNIREMCNAILYYQATLGKDNNEYKEFIKNFIKELNDEKYKKVGCSNMKERFIDKFQRIGKSEGIEINFYDPDYGSIQYDSYFKDDNKLISRLELLASKISRDIKAKNRTKEGKNSTLDKIGDLLLNFNEKITDNKLNGESIKNFCNSLKSNEEYSLSDEEISIVKGFISYASNNFFNSKYSENLEDIIGAKIKEIVGEEEYKIYKGESEDAREELGEALVESLSGNQENRLSYS